MKKVYTTHRGEKVKSAGEKRIADYLDYRHIDYEYEKPFKRKDGGINHPDFYLNNEGVYIEYYGMHHKNPDYDAITRLKRKTFEDEGLDVIEIYPAHLKNNTLRQGIDCGLQNCHPTS